MVAGCWIVIGYLTLELKRLDSVGLFQFSKRNWIFMRRLVEWEKLACYWMDGIDGLGGPDGMGVGWMDS